MYVIYILFGIYIIPSSLPMKVHAMLLHCSMSKMALESQPKEEQNFHYVMVF